MEETKLLSLLLGILIPLPLFLVLYKTFSPPPNKKKANIKVDKSQRFQTATECRSIIDGSIFPIYNANGSTRTKKNLLSRYEARAAVAENQAMRKAFGIQNPFTTEEDEYARAFVKDLQSLMGRCGFSWASVRDAVRETGFCAVDEMEIRACLGQEVTATYEIDLDSLIQGITLKALLCVFFPFHKEVEYGKLAKLGGIIHRILMNATGGPGKAGKVIDFEDNIPLHRALADVFPEDDMDILLSSRSNPLALIIPGFDPLWRISRGLFLQIHNDESTDWATILSQFVQKPTVAQFRLELELRQGGVSAEFIIKEALRLYTPTQQIKRVFQFTGLTEQVVGIADVQACHLDEKIWGEDVNEFSPGRWKKVSLMQDLSFLPFGSRLFLCPVHAEVGPMLVGLIVGVLLEAFGDWGMKPDCGDAEGDAGSNVNTRGDGSAHDGVILVMPPYLAETLSVS